MFHFFLEYTPLFEFVWSFVVWYIRILGVMGSIISAPQWAEMRILSCFRRAHALRGAMGGNEARKRASRSFKPRSGSPKLYPLRGAMAWGAIEVVGRARHEAVGITNAGRRAGATGD